MRIHIPASDQPRWAGVLLVAAAGLSVGIALAAWGTSAPRRQPEQDARALDQDPAAALLQGARVGLTVAEDPEATALGAAEPEPEESEALAPEGAEPEGVEPEAAEPAVLEPAAREPAPRAPALAPGSLRLERGRVAYLRCDLASGRDCVRDEPLEAAVWTALEQLMQCRGAPRAAGEADIRLDYRGGAPEVQWRDTFGDDVVRLDRESVLACLRGPLSQTRRSIDAQRLLVSFRFTVR